jgi:pyruvate-formate lyase-activating enzyme
VPSDGVRSDGEFVPPAEFVARARELRCQGTSISFNEPTLNLEWSLEVFHVARAAGLYNTFVTNGYMTEQALELLVDAGLDGMNVDVKGDEKAVSAFTAPPTPVATLEHAREIGQQAGLHYVYVGNVPGHPGEHTFCPNCGTILARRGLLRLLHCDVTPDGQCPRCGQKIAGVGWAWKRRGPRLAPGKGVFSKQLS